MAARRPPQVLVVDDEVLVSTVLRRLLKQLGASCEVVHDGEAAVVAARATWYDLILMDVNMPGLDGASATRAILDGAPPERRPVVVGMTAGVDEGQRRACLDAGMAALLDKPVRLADLAPWLAARGGA